MQQVVRLSGASEHVDFGVVVGAQFERSDAFSVSFWFRARHSTDVYRSIISCIDASGVGWTCRLVSSGHTSGTTGVLQFLMAGASQTRDVYWSNGALDDRKWHHVVITSDGVNAAGVSITVDGVTATTTVSDTLTSETIIGTSPQLVLGAHQPAGSDYFLGEVTHAAVWDIELSASEVEETWQGGQLVDLTGHSAYADAVVYTRMVSDTYPTLIDSKGTANGTLTNMESRDLVIDQPPVCGTSAKFEGVDDIAATGSTSEYNFERTDTFSALCWVSTSADNTGLLLGKMLSTGLLSGWGMYLQSGGTITVTLRSDFGGGDLLTVSADEPINDGEWHCLAFTYDGSSTGAGVTIYVDGVAVAVTVDTDSLASSIMSVAEFTIGARFGGSMWLTGLVSEAAVYDKELSAGEVSDVYGAGRPPHLRAASMPSNLVGYWKMGDWDDESIFRDFSTNSNDLTTAGMVAANLVYASPPNIRTNVATYSMRFNDEDDEVAVSNPSQYDFAHTDSFTFATWIRWFGDSPGNNPVFSTKESDSTGSGYILRLRDGAGTNFLDFAITGSGGTSGDEAYVRTSAEFSMGVWRHVAVTYDGSTAAAGIQIYIDGVAVAMTILGDTLSTAPDSTQGLVIGNRIVGNSKYFNGRIADVRVYERELAAEEVRELAGQREVTTALESILSGWLTGWWRMGDGGASVSVVYEDSPYKNDATATGFTTNTVEQEVPEPLSAPASPMEFDGMVNWSEGLADTPELKFERDDPFTISFWYQGTSTSNSIVLNNFDPSINNGWQTRITSAGVVRFFLRETTGTNEVDVSTTVVVNDGVLHHVIVTYDGSSSAAGVDFYIDGEQVGESVLYDTLTSDINSGHTTPVHLGRRASDGLFSSVLLEGICYDVAVFDKALNPAEIKLLYGAGSGVDISVSGVRESLVSWWRLDLDVDPDGFDNFRFIDSGARYFNPMASEGIFPFERGVPEAAAIDIGEDVGLPIVTITYAMRAIADPGPGYLHWVTVGAPDPNGDDAPGSIVVGSAVVAGQWGGDKVTVPA